MTHVSLGHAFAGGTLIGAGIAALLLFDGQIAGISGIVDRALHRSMGEQGWRAAFLAGLLLPAIIFGTGRIDWQASPSILVLSGALVGFGTRMGSGCTSGHGVCGIANLSLRSVIATVTFIAVAAITVAVGRWIHV